MFGIDVDIVIVHVDSVSSMSVSSISVSVLAAMAIHRLRNDAHVADACLFDGVHHGSEGAKWNIFIGAQENRLMLRVANPLLQLRSDLVDVDGIVAEKHSLRFVDADYEALFGDLLDGAGVGHVDFDSGLKNRRGHHENNKQHEDDVDQGRDVDVRERGLGASVAGCEGHQRRASVGWGACWRSTRFSISRVKSSLRAAISRMEPMIRL